MISGMWGFALFVFVWDDEDEDEDTILHNQDKKTYLRCSYSSNSSLIKSSLRNQKNSLIYITVRAIFLCKSRDFEARGADKKRTLKLFALQLIAEEHGGHKISVQSAFCDELSEKWNRVHV